MLRGTTLKGQEQMDSIQPCATRCANGRWGATRAQPCSSAHANGFDLSSTTERHPHTNSKQTGYGNGPRC
eukprot:11216612-Lingulodinium_polyedra.AAC.1